jgi:protein-S-isoprenylcysteine O-methyltransferase Ste14
MSIESKGGRGSVLTKSVAIVVIFSIVWATLHSLLASEPVKRRVRKRLGPEADRWYRVFFNLLAGLTLWPIVPLLLFLPNQVLYVVRPPWRWLMHAGQAIAAAAVAGAVVQTGWPRFVGLAQLLGSQVQRLQTTRLYGCVRHPMAVFSILFFWLSPTMTVTRMTAFAMATVYFAVGTFLEEPKLLARFGDAYRAYRDEVPRFVPRPGRCLRAWELANRDEAGSRSNLLD